MNKGQVFIGVCSIVFVLVLAVTVPVKTYVPQCSIIIDAPQRSSLILGQSPRFDSIVEKGNIVILGPTMGACKASSQKFELYVL